MTSGFQYTDRDLAALRELGEVGLLSTDMLQQRHYTAGQNGRKYLQERLRKLVEIGVVEAVKITLNTPGGPRKLPHTYRLTPAGAEELATLCGVQATRPARSDPPSPLTLLHRLGVVQTRLAISDACQRAGLAAPSWIMEQDTYPNFKHDDPYDKKFILYESFGHGAERVVCRPDASCHIRLPGDPPWNLILYVEYDRSTEGRDQIIAKIPGYASLLVPTGRHYRRHWPEVLERDFARVCFVCRSRERLNNLRAWIARRPASAYVRFIVEDDLRPDRLLTTPVWIDVNGNARCILPQ